ncbi:MAG: CerR family C-terminal domain-containing protein [Pseudomonadales bacterium]
MSKARPLRGEGTRDALIQAGIEIFGRDGFHAASSRSLAAAAGVNQALIGYHFGSKHGLYLAVFEHVTAQLADQLVPVATRVGVEIAAIEHSSGKREARCIDAMETLMFTMLQLLSQPQTAGWAKLIVREQQEPTEAFDILYDGMMGRMLGVLTRLVALAGALDERSQEARLCALTLVGQVLVFRVANAALQRHLGWHEGIGSAELNAIRTQLRINLESRFGRRGKS